VRGFSEKFFHASGYPDRPSLSMICSRLLMDTVSRVFIEKIKNDGGNTRIFTVSEMQFHH